MSGGGDLLSVAGLRVGFGRRGAMLEARHHLCWYL